MEAERLLEGMRGRSRLGARGSLPAWLTGGNDGWLALLTEVKHHLPSQANGDLGKKCSGLILNHPFNQLRVLTDEGGRGCPRPRGLGFLIKEQVTAGRHGPLPITGRPPCCSGGDNVQTRFSDLMSPAGAG